MTAFHAELSGTRLSAFTCQLLPPPPISPTLSLSSSHSFPLFLSFSSTRVSLLLSPQTHIHTCSASFSTLDGITTRLHHRHHRLLLLPPPLDQLFVFLFAVFRLSSPRLAAYLTSLGHVGNSSSLSPFVEVPEVPTFNPRLPRLDSVTTSRWVQPRSCERVCFFGNEVLPSNATLLFASFCI